MNEHASWTTKEISAERWLEWCGIFANGNRGHSLDVNLAVDELGTETPAEPVLVAAIDLASFAKGNDFVVFCGQEQSPIAHVVPAPVSLWEVHDADGVVVALQIEDQGGRSTVLSFDQVVRDVENTSRAS